uniref:Carbonic anhydrase n=1 Tax=Xiphophorus couchianus TaxID=32473 RepID=A0A3B5KQ43_9TELE
TNSVIYVSLPLFQPMSALTGLKASGSFIGHTPEHWEALPGSHCGGEKQSPIDIVTSIVTIDPNLDNFIFVNFSSQSAIKNITNNGHSGTKLDILGTEVSGGGLDGDYSVLQFHFHWDVADHSGSEHALDGHHYPMEMHIVTAKKGVLPNETLNHEDGLAVLGFFIDATEDGNLSWPWETFTSYLNDVTGNVKVDNITIDDLIGDVDLTKFYRYMGSLTTPYCHEAVVWTLFHEPIKVHKDLVSVLSRTTNMPHRYTYVDWVSKLQKKPLCTVRSKVGCMFILPPPTMLYKVREVKTHFLQPREIQQFTLDVNCSWSFLLWEAL